MVGALWRTLDHLGVDPALAIEADLYRPGEEPSGKRARFDQYDRALASAAELVGNPALGLRIAEQLHPSHVGSLGYAWLASSSLATALHRLQRFHRVLNDSLQLWVREDDDRLTVGASLNRVPLCPEILGDVQIGSLFLFCKLNFGTQLRPLNVSLRRQRPEQASEWDAFFDVTVRFDEPHNSITFRGKDAHKTLTGSNRELAYAHENMLEHYLARQDRTRVTGRVRAILIEQLPSGSPSADRVAAELNMNTRTLHRKLASDDTSFRALLAEVRRDLSRQYVSASQHDITEIAFMLGYSDSSSFSRAFRSWFGKSPREARAAST
jgi:AraC-like DNA-binding protein